MEKIAIISDIHGNVPALEAVLEDIQKRSIKRIFCLGDLVGKGPHSEKTVDIIRQTCEVVVQGNWDEMITREHTHETMKWHQMRLGKERLDYLDSLPFSHEFLMSGKLIRLFHASANSLFTRVYPWSSMAEQEGMFANTEMTHHHFDQTPDVVGYGDIHYAFLHHIQHRILFNTGSVGNPLEITQASYAIMEGEYESNEPSSFSVQLVRVPYDIELAVAQARAENMPALEEYIVELRTAVYRGRQKK